MGKFVVVENEPDFDWNIGIICGIIPDHKDCYHRKTWSSEIFRTDVRFLCGLRAYGPYRSEYRILLKNENKQKYPSTPLVLIGTGAGSAFLIDFYHYIENNDIALSEEVQFHFSTRSITMFQWFTDITCHKNIDNLFVNAHLTSHGNIAYPKKMENAKKMKSRDSNIGRLNIEQILTAADKNTNVFFCGSPIVQNQVGNLCKCLNLTYHQGHSF